MSILLVGSENSIESPDDPWDAFRESLAAVFQVPQRMLYGRMFGEPFEVEDTPELIESRDKFTAMLARTYFQLELQFNEALVMHLCGFGFSEAAD